MKKLILNLMALTILATFTSSCGSEEGATTDTENKKEMTPKDKIQGSWKIIAAEGEMADINIGTIYSFDGDNYGMKKGIIDNKGKILEMTDNSYKAQFDGMQTEYSFDFKFDGDKLIITPTGSGQSFTLEKQ